MESQYSIGQNQQLQLVHLPDITVDVINQKLSLIYHDILTIEEEDPSIKFNRNISFFNKIMRHDPLFKEALKKIKNIANFILENKLLTKEQIKQISTTYMKLKENLLIVENQLDSVENILKKAASIHVLYQALAAASYYYQLHQNKIIETAFGSYMIRYVIENNQGLRVLYFEPIGEWIIKTPPVLSIRGTVSGNAANAFDDLHSSIGSLTFESGKKELFELLTNSLIKFPQGCVLVGHSLGGAIAQQIAAYFPYGGLISRVYHYNSPGIGRSLVKQYKEICEKLEVCPEIIEVRHECDLLSYFGGYHLPVTKRIVVKDNESNEIITYKKAHEILRLMEKSHQSLVDTEIIDNPKELGFWKGHYNYFTIETLRWSLAPFFRLIVWSTYSDEKPVCQVEEIETEEISEENYFVKKLGV